MEHAERAFAETVSERLAELGTNAFAIEKAHNLPADTVRSVLRGLKKSGTTLNSVQAICEALGLELYIGPPRAPEPDRPVFTIDGSEFVPLPLHSALLAAGLGFGNDAEDVVGHMAFRRDWLRRIGVPASHAVLARARGDSMRPVISDGDVLLIDIARRDPPGLPRTKESRRLPPIFAFLDEGDARVKRIQRMDEQTLALLSDNPDYSPEFRHIASVDLIGRVMWWGHTEV